MVANFRQLPCTGYQGGGTTWDALYPETNPQWSSQYNFHPWVQGPNTAHSMETSKWHSCLIGGPAGQLGTTSGGGGPFGGGGINMIYAGLVYDSYIKPGTNGATYWRCTNLRTVN